jgi:hypothetical protein
MKPSNCQKNKVETLNLKVSTKTKCKSRDIKKQNKKNGKQRWKAKHLVTNLKAQDLKYWLASCTHALPNCL